MKANRPHYHVWLKARGGRMRYRLARGFHTRQAAHQWSQRNYRGDRERDPKIEQCEDERCAPKLD